MLQDSNLRYSVMLAFLLSVNIAFTSAQVNTSQNVETFTIVDDADIKAPAGEVEWVNVDNLDVVKVESDDKVYDIVDQQPEFPGGEAALMDFIRKNIKYPEYAKNFEIEGRVIVSFIVERDGSIGDIKIAKTLLVELDEEARRIVSIMPDWKPGIKDGKPVRVQYTLPINFRLDEIPEAITAEDQDKRVEKLSFRSLTAKVVQNKREMATPQVTNDPSDENNVCLSLTYGASPLVRSDAQLLLYCNKPFERGDTIFVSLRVKASSKQKFTSEIHSTPGTRLLSPSGESEIDENWAMYSLKYVISNNSDAQTIVIDVADNKSGNTCYFDDMKIEAHHLFRVKNVVEQPEFPGGLQAMKDYLQENNKYPAPGRGKGAFLDVNFDLDSDGTIHNPRTTDGLDSLLNAEAIRLVLGMPVWLPLRINGEPISCEFTIPIEFDNSMVPIERQNRSNEVFLVVEDQPEFPGGAEALLTFLRENIKYPAICRENGIQGRVLVTFVVNTDGTISQIEVVKSVNPALDKEAIRVIGKMPRWKPGQQKGKPVRVKYTVPINFKLG